MMLPDKLPERGRFRALYAWLNQMRECIQFLTPAISHGTRLAFTSAGVIREANPAAESVTGIAFKGEWVDRAYAKDDIVTRGAVGSGIGATLETIGAPGTYIALKAVLMGTPAPEQPNAGDYWRTLARFATHAFYIAKTGEGSILMKTADCHKPDGTWIGLTVREYPICILENGVKKQKYFLAVGSATYERT